MNAVIKANRVNLKKFLKKKRIIATPKNVDFSKNATSKTKKNLIKISVLCLKGKNNPIEINREAFCGDPNNPIGLKVLVPNKSELYVTCLIKPNKSGSI